MGLGFFNDINIPIYKGGFEIIFTRNHDSNALFRWKNDKNELTAEGKVIIDTFYLKLPILEYSSEAKNKLINGFLAIAISSNLTNGSAFNI